MAEGGHPPGRVLVTGSTDGIGAEIARRLETDGWDVVRHARSPQRAEQCRSALAAGAEVVVGDLASLGSTRRMAEQLRDLGPFDVIVHNAGWSPPAGPRRVSADGIEQALHVNAVAPYLLTATVPLPRRLVLVSSDSIRNARLELDDLQHERDWEPGTAYARSKLAGTVLAAALARRYPELVCTAAHPGWVRTKLAGEEAPLDVGAGADGIVWLVESDEAGPEASGRLFHDRQQVDYNDQVQDVHVQDALLEAFEELTGTPLPR